MKNWEGLRAKTPIPDTQNQPLKKRGLREGHFRGGKGGAVYGGAWDSSPIEYVFELTEGLYGDRKSREGQRCIESTVR